MTADWIVSKRQKGTGAVGNKEAEISARMEQSGARAANRRSLFEGKADKSDRIALGMFFNKETVDFDESGPENFTNLGALLVYLRETYPSRLVDSNDGRPLGPKVSVAALSIAEYLKEHGYSMSSGSYSLLEQGRTLPGTPITFFTLLCDCLAVKPNSKYRPLLLSQYVFDAAARSVGEQFADTFVPHGSRALSELRARVTASAAQGGNRNAAAARVAGALA